MNNLAIIIPAYKINFFERALSSFSNQSDKRFNIYIGNDNGSSDIEVIVEKYINKLNIFYHKFENNIGGLDLVAQWKRCVSLSKNEEWIWLFSDDDIADYNCVENLYKAFKNTNYGYDIYRFNTRVINKFDEIIEENIESPQIENSMQLAYQILMLNRGNCMPDQIVRRKLYNENGGYVNFKFAQAADWATAIHFSYKTGIFTINNAKISWRTSGENISSMAYLQKFKMIYGHIEFIYWINRRYTKEDQSLFNLPLEKIKSASIYNLQMILKKHYLGIPVFEFFKVSNLIAKALKWNLLKAYFFVLKIQLPITSKRILNKLQIS